MPNCGDCGAELVPGEARCRECGAEVGAAESGAAATVAESGSEAAPAEAGSEAAPAEAGIEPESAQPDSEPASAEAGGAAAVAAADSEPTPAESADETAAAQPGGEPTAPADEPAPAQRSSVPVAAESTRNPYRPWLVALVIVLGVLLMGGIVAFIASLPMFTSIELVSSSQSDIEASNAASSSVATAGAPTATSSGSPSLATTGTAKKSATQATPKTAPATAAQVGTQTAEITAVKTTGGSRKMTVDYVQVLTGAEAETAAQAHGDEVTNDYYVVNDNTKLRTFPIASGAVIVLHPGEGAKYKRTFSLSHFAELFDSGGEETIAGRTYRAKDWLYYVTLKDGAIVRVENYWTP